MQENKDSVPTVEDEDQSTDKYLLKGAVTKEALDKALDLIEDQDNPPRKSIDDMTTEEYEAWIAEVSKQSMKDAKKTFAKNDFKPVGPAQTRRCVRGHEWILQRMHADVGEDGSACVSYTKGTLTCPECKGYAVESFNHDEMPPELQNDTIPFVRLLSKRELVLIVFGFLAIVFFVISLFLP